MSNNSNPRRPVNSIEASRAAAAGKEIVVEPRAVEEPSKDEVSERQQRSMLARQAYLERQQAEARKADSRPVVTCADTAQRHQHHDADAAELEFGSDSFDDGLNDALATYDETEMGDAEAASHALEMEIDEAHRQRHAGGEDTGDVSVGLHPNHNAADDSGVAFPSSETNHHGQVKQEKVVKEAAKTAWEMRRSTSPVKQVRMEAAKAPRRAGSVGRFISPPPQAAPTTTSAPRGAASAGTASIVSGSGRATYISGANTNAMRNGTSSLSAASSGAAAASRNGPQQNPPRRVLPASLAGMGGGVEAAAAKGRDPMAGRAIGEAVDHAFVPTEQPLPRGVKRPGEPVTAMEIGRGLGGPPARPQQEAVGTRHA